MSTLDPQGALGFNIILCSVVALSHVLIRITIGLEIVLHDLYL